MTLNLCERNRKARTMFFVGNTICTSRCIKLSFNSGMSASVSVQPYCTGFPSVVPFATVCHAPLMVGDQEKAKDQIQFHRKRVCQNVLRIKEGVNIWHTLESHSLVIATCLTGFISSFARSSCKSIRHVC